MKDFETKTHRSKPAHSSKKVASANFDNANSTVSNFRPYLIQRKAGCACGGGCPTCQNESANLPVSQPSDASEIEADNVADKVMRMSDGDTRKPAISQTAKLSRKNSGRDVAETIPRKEKNAEKASHNVAKNSMIKDVLNSTGQPLSSETKSFFEPRFGHDFSNVRVHTDSSAAQSAKSVNALAYTVGDNIVFNQNQYHPQTETGKTLLAHELAHTIQQNGQINRQEDMDAGVSEPRDAGSEPRDADVPVAGVPLPEDAGAPEQQDAGVQDPKDAGAEKQTPAPAPPAPVFALTFDDGPHAAGLGAGANRTENVLNTLNTKGLRGKAAFFIQTAAEDGQGHAIRGSNPNGRLLVERMHREGYGIGIHTGGTADHEDHTTAANAGRLQGELASAEAYIHGITGSDPTYVRAPHGNIGSAGSTTRQAITATYANLGLTHLLWDIDGDAPGANMTLDQLKAQFNAGYAALRRNSSGRIIPTTPSSRVVVLYHDIRRGTAANIGGVIDHIRATVPGATFEKP
jgi:peptidoglycan/xylan/chitin deacetylase (PgdA/CDA1 family)